MYHVWEVGCLGFGFVGCLGYEIFKTLGIWYLGFSECEIYMG